MANLANTLTQSLRAKYPNNLDKNELRASRYGAWDFAQIDTRTPESIFDPEIMGLVTQSFGNSVVIPVLDAETVTIGNIRSCTVPDSENTSQLVTLTFITYAFGFTMYPAQHYNNDVKRQADYDRKLKKYLLQFAADLDSRVITTLDAAKNQLWTDIGGYYSETADALQVAQAEKNDFFNNAQSILETMDFYGEPNVVASTSLGPLRRRLDNQGSNNGTNETFQLDPYTWYNTNRIANGGGIQSTGYLIQDGSIAIANRNDPDAVLGHRKSGGDMEWGEVVMPIVNLKMGSFYREDCSDGRNLNSGTSGLTRTFKESYEFSTDICFQTVYNSSIATRYNPIVKFEISAT